MTSDPTVTVQNSANLGSFNVGHRNYSAGVLGRFISRDPIGFNGSSMNLYAYPTNPVNAVDPSGLKLRFVGSNSHKLISFLESATGLMFLNSGEGLQRIVSFEIMEGADSELAQIVLALANSEKDFQVNVDCLSAAFFGHFEKTGEQTIDMGDIEEIGKLNPEIARLLVGHELYELYHSRSSGVPYTASDTADNYRAVYDPLHKRAVNEYENGKGFMRHRETGFSSYDPATGRSEGSLSWWGVGTFDIKNAPGSCNIKLRR